MAPHDTWNLSGLSPKRDCNTEKVEVLRESWFGLEIWNAGLLHQGFRNRSEVLETPSFRQQAVFSLVCRAFVVFGVFTIRVVFAEKSPYQAPIKSPSHTCTNMYVSILNLIANVRKIASTGRVADAWWGRSLGRYPRHRSFHSQSRDRYCVTYDPNTKFTRLRRDTKSVFRSAVLPFILCWAIGTWFEEHLFA